MSKAIALSRSAARHSAHYARAVVVLACAATVMFAGQAFPVF